jgi:hypothetical protein
MNRTVSAGPAAPMNAALLGRPVTQAKKVATSPSTKDTVTSGASLPGIPRRTRNDPYSRILSLKNKLFAETGTMFVTDSKSSSMTPLEGNSVYPLLVQTPVTRLVQVSKA